MLLCCSRNETQMAEAPTKGELKHRHRPKWFFQRLTFFLGVLFIGGGIAMLRLGTDCIFQSGWMGSFNHTRPNLTPTLNDVQGDCPFFRGGILSGDGLASLYVGILFFGLTFARKLRKVCLVILLDTLMVGLFFVAIGLGCIIKPKPLEPLICAPRTTEGLLIIVFGSAVSLFALMPSLTLTCQFVCPLSPKHGVGVKFFWFGSTMAMWCLIIYGFGEVCEMNALKLIGIKDCPRTETMGPWSIAMKALYWGALGLLLSSLIFIFSFFERAVHNSTDFAKSNRVFMIGLLLFIAACIWGVIGAFCLADNLLGVPDCTNVYDTDAMLIFGFTGALSGIVIKTVGWYKFKGIEPERFITILWALTALLTLVGGVGALVGGTCLAQTEIWLSGDCSEGWGTIGWPVARNIFLLAIFVLFCNMGFHPRWIGRMHCLDESEGSNLDNAFQWTPQMRHVFAVLCGGEGMIWYGAAITTGAISFSIGVPCLTGSLLVYPDCPDGIGAMLTATGACLFCLSLAVFILRTVDARGRERIEQRATDEDAEWKRWTPNPQCLPRNGLTVWPKPQVGSGTHLGKLTLGEEVVGCIVALGAKSATGWLRVTWPPSSSTGEAGWILAKVASTQYVLPVLTADGEPETVAKPTLGIEAALRKAEQFKALMIERKGVLEQRLRMVQDEIVCEDNDGDGIEEMKRKLAKYHAAHTAVNSVGPAAGRDFSALRAELDATMRAHAMAEQQATAARAAVIETSHALSQEVGASTELRKRAAELQGRKGAAEAALRRLEAETATMRDNEASRLNAQFFEHAVAQGWIGRDDHVAGAELQAEFQMWLGVERENARLAAAVAEQRGQLEQKQVGIEEARQLLLHGGALEEHNTHLQQALEVATGEAEAQKHQMDWLRLTVDSADDDTDGDGESDDDSDEDRHHHFGHRDQQQRHTTHTTGGADSSSSGEDVDSEESDYSDYSDDDGPLFLPPPPPARLAPAARGAPPAVPVRAPPRLEMAGFGGGSPATRLALAELDGFEIRRAPASSPAITADLQLLDDVQIGGGSGLGFRPP